MSTTTDSARAQKRGTTMYERYLHTDDLFALQTPPEEQVHPDELTFQVVHQTFELWWKMTLQQMRLAGELLDADKADEAAWALRRAVTAQGVVMQAIRQLEFVAPADFLVIRTVLGDGSGADSPGFKSILRTAPDLWDAFERALGKAKVPLLALYQHPQEHFALYQCAEALTDFDEQFHLFRAAHLKLAQRNLGLQAIGTGGTPMQMLERTLGDLLFLPLWQARDELLNSMSNQSHAQKGHGE
jgi:tryptophan 2,3-dioxygenase